MLSDTSSQPSPKEREHRRSRFFILHSSLFTLQLILLTACNGVLDGLYDNGDDGGKGQKSGEAVTGSLYVDASSWTDWYYIDLHAIRDSIIKGAEPNITFEPYPIPTSETETFDEDMTGIYTYWYDIFGEGVSKKEYRSSYPTQRQQEPEEWDIAVHRNNVRTNGGAICQTTLKDVTAATIADGCYVEDTMNETDVWTIQAQMLQCLIGNQRIRVNSELGKWLDVQIPPIPPSFTHNDNVFILRMNDNTYAALRLANYLSPTGTKCCLTIEYKYPLGE